MDDNTVGLQKDKRQYFIQQRRPPQAILLHFNFHICTARICKTLKKAARQERKLRLNS